MSYYDFGYYWDNKPSPANLYETDTQDFGGGWTVNIQEFFIQGMDEYLYAYAVGLGYNTLRALLYSFVEVPDRPSLIIRIYKDAVLMYTWKPFFGHEPGDNISDRITDLTNGYMLQCTNFGGGSDPYLTFQFWYNNPQDPDNIYVHSVSGSDSPPNFGTISLPYKTYLKSLTDVNTSGLIHVMNSGADFTGELIPPITKSHDVGMDSPGYFDFPSIGVSKGPATLPLTGASSGLTDVTAYDGTNFTGTSVINAFWLYATGNMIFKLRLFDNSHVLKQEIGTFVADPGLNKYIISDYTVVNSGDHIGLYLVSGGLPTMNFTGNYVYWKSGDNSDMSSGGTYIYDKGIPIIAILVE